MLPSSHFVLINAGPGHVCPPEDSLQGDGAAIELRDRGTATRQLASAFSEFIAVSSHLESSYRGLQEEVAELRAELAKRNAALQCSVAENERIRRNLEQIVGSMPCGVLVLDEDGTVSLANPESRRLLDLPCAGTGSELPDLSGISAAPELDLPQLIRLATNQETIHEICIRRGSKDRWLEVRVRRLEAPQAGATTEAARAIVILRDVTQRKRAEQERENGRRALALAEVSSEVAHEIRNPLAALELFAGLIEQDEAQRSTWISHLRAGIRSLSATVNNVLSLRSGTFKLEIMNLAEAIEAALSFARPLLTQAELTVEWNAAAVDRKILGCPAAVQQVMLNLITNAIRHTPAGGTLKVCLSPESTQERGVASDCLVLHFADSGAGIPAEHLDRIFEPGFSGSGATSGLGLSVCEQIMRTHGGNITAGNRAEGGARFDLVFPIYREGDRAA